MCALGEANALFWCYTSFSDVILETSNQDHASGELLAPLDIVRQSSSCFPWQSYDLIGFHIRSTPGLVQVLEALAYL